jgi:hypothetical protein
MTREATITETEVIALGWWTPMEAMPVPDESQSRLDAATDAEEIQPSPGSPSITSRASCGR